MDTDTNLAKTRALADDKALKKITAQFYKLVNSNLTGDALLGNHELLVSQIQQFSTACHKGSRLQVVTALEVAEYQNQVAQLEEEHQETLETLEVLKLKLERATEERSNKIEYDLLAKKISKLPDRQTAQQTNSALTADIAALHNLSEKYQGTWSTRFNDFNSIIDSLTTLTESIKEEKMEEQRRLLLEDGEAEEGETAESGETVDVVMGEAEEKEEGEE